jgi:hypothetical protein
MHHYPRAHFEVSVFYSNTAISAGLSLLPGLELQRKSNCFAHRRVPSRFSHGKQAWRDA